MRIILSLILLGLLCASAAPLQAREYEPFLSMPEKALAIGLSAQEIASGAQASMSVAMPDEVDFVIRRAAPNGIDVLAIYGDKAENLVYELTGQMPGFDQYGELESGFYLQLAACDLNGDNLPEIIVALGDQVAILNAMVFVSQAGNEQPRFVAAGLVEAQNKIIINDNGVIEAPYGSQGLFTSYQLDADSKLRKN